ncbi:MAG: hypothetical protein N2C14_12640, partial [Planctomycetales bacterium]
DRCPKCWETWDFKWDNPACSHCDAELGENCKILLDNDVCPNCEKGKVSLDNPQCDQCAHEANTRFIEWG